MRGLKDENDMSSATPRDTHALTSRQLSSFVSIYSSHDNEASKNIGPAAGAVPQDDVTYLLYRQLRLKMPGHDQQAGRMMRDFAGETSTMRSIHAYRHIVAASRPR